mmetsp:Transcript_20590/g.35113  ORF Transcript_20590/g.35113 Transcript_20590/m.35113 type:complete len:205 (+) Transcript_20590:287-901(+)
MVLSAGLSTLVAPSCMVVLAPESSSATPSVTSPSTTGSSILPSSSTGSSTLPSSFSSVTLTSEPFSSVVTSSTLFASGSSSTATGLSTLTPPSTMFLATGSWGNGSAPENATAPASLSTSLTTSVSATGSSNKKSCGDSSKTSATGLTSRVCSAGFSSAGFCSSCSGWFSVPNGPAPGANASSKLAKFDHPPPSVPPSITFPSC